MKRIASLLLAGATLVAAQTAAIDTAAQHKKMDAINKMKTIDTLGHARGMLDNDDTGKFVRPANDTGKFVRPAKDTGAYKMHHRDSSVVVDSLKKKLHDGLQGRKCHGDSAKLAAQKMREQLRGKSSADSAKIINNHKGQTNNQLQNATNALSNTPSNTNAQVNQVHQETLKRMADKQKQFQQRQEQINNKKQQTNTTNTTTTTTN
jgi:hypothetical protein